tara:strand:- start:2479 stop:3342 length:864 start_codon:yes stop_codon:yes gene_type:complete
MNFLDDIRFFSQHNLDKFNKIYKNEYCYLIQKQLNTGAIEVITEDKIDYYVEYPTITENPNVNYFSFNNFFNYNDLIKKYKQNFFLKNSFNDISFFENNIIEVKKLLKYHYNKKISFNWKSLLFELFENDYINTELPFKRDIMIVRNVYKQVVAICYVSGLLFKSKDISLLNDKKISILFEKNSDLKENLYNHFNYNEREILEDYLNSFKQNHFIDSIYVSEKYRFKGICEKIYMALFHYYNKNNQVKLTSGSIHQQSPEIIKLWEKLEKKYPTQVFKENNSNYILF